MATLEIISAALEDSGYYACLAKNPYGQASTEATIRVYPIYDALSVEPSYTSIRNDKYKIMDKQSNIFGQLIPSISCQTNERILRGNRYRSSTLGHGIFRLQTSESDISNNAHQHGVRFHGKENSKIPLKNDDSIYNQLYNTGRKREELPQISTSLADYKVPAGGTIALQVEIKDSLAPNVTWLRRNGEKKEPISSPKTYTFSESGVYTLILPEATESEAGTYVCRVSNAYGHVDTSTTVEVIPLSKFDDLGKPAAFVSQPTDKTVHVTDGEAASISFRVSGIPKPKVIWMKGIKDISDGPRTHKEAIDDYVRLTLNRVNSDDEGTYCILVKNCYGCDRSFFTLKAEGEIFDSDI
ncbi:PREDICTED: CAVP-target protein-like [Ceratosolen solmsi marchali]|uniref:CAVP-target protein-like n=1 Tax=Ceratosolen solmsi marchali TaxID=326594 RepID=A0AAJ7DTF2_9HYME|nr:PREDICTED: CAVP-target protein-like [Ceratosolen solmsi marchali]